VPATDSPPTRCGRAASSCRHARAALRARSDGLLAGRRTPRPEMHTPRTRCAHVAHATHMHMPCACHAHAIAHAVARTVHAPSHAAAHYAVALRGDAPRTSLHLPISPHISPYLPIPPHISHRAVALRGHAPRAARRGHGRGRARPCRARTPNASSWRGRVAPQPHPCRATRPNWLWAALRTPDGAPEEWEGPGACSRCGGGALSCGRSA